MSISLPQDMDGIQTLLDQCLETEFTFIKTAEAARKIADLAPAEREFVLIWVRRLASTNIQIAYRFISHTIDILAEVEKSIIEEWALHAMDQYDQFGLRAALLVIDDFDNFVAHSRERAFGAVYRDYAGILLHFAHGLSGRRLALAEDEQSWTDTETIHLPPVLAIMDKREDNFLVYKCMVAFQWAQTRFGTFRAPWSELLVLLDPADNFWPTFFSLETRRLEFCIARELPGLYRDMQMLQQKLGAGEVADEWRPVIEQLSEPDVAVDQVIELSRQFAHLSPALPERFFQGSFELESTLAVMAVRIKKEKARLRVMLSKILDELQQEPVTETDKARSFSRKRADDDSQFGLMPTELTLDDKPVLLPEPARELLTSIVLDLGDIPDDYLVPAGPGEYDPALYQQHEPDPDEVWKGTYHEEGAFLYDEWDFQRQHYHKNWCAVREHSVRPVYDDFVGRTLQKYSGLVKHLRRTFEAMRDEDRLLKRQVQGDDVDIDALVEALADARDGREMSDSLYTQLHRSERNIAVCFMVDMSGSTKGWINEAEREALTLLAETLETLGDRYAIYGFSGMARKRCEIYKIKAFAENYDDEIKARISGMEPKDYTRMGFAIRHLTRLLNQVDAKTRVLITLSDGKPDDYDSYRGEYGIEDTRRALLESRYAGIHPYCITIDKEAKDYLPHMYGPAGYTVIDEVRKLPLKVSDIYRRLTT